MEGTLISWVYAATRSKAWILPHLGCVAGFGGLVSHWTTCLASVTRLCDCFEAGMAAGL